MRVPRLGIMIGMLLAPAPVCPAFGQWSAALEVGAERYWGGSADTGGEKRSFRPYRPTTFGIGLEHKSNRFAWGVQAHYTEAALGLEGQGAVAALEGVFTIVSVWPEVIFHLNTLGPVAEFRLHAGPLLEAWGIIEEHTKIRVGAQGALSMDIPLGGHFAGSALVGIALTPSPFETAQLGDGFEPRALWRRRFAAAVHYRL